MFTLNFERHISSLIHCQNLEVKPHLQKVHFFILSPFFGLSTHLCFVQTFESFWISSSISTFPFCLNIWTSAFCLSVWVFTFCLCYFCKSTKDVPNLWRHWRCQSCWNCCKNTTVGNVHDRWSHMCVPLNTI